MRHALSAFMAALSGCLTPFLAISTVVGLVGSVTFLKARCTRKFVQGFVDLSLLRDSKPNRAAGQQMIEALLLEAMDR